MSLLLCLFYFSLIGNFGLRTSPPSLHCYYIWVLFIPILLYCVSLISCKPSTVLFQRISHTHPFFPVYYFPFPLFLFLLCCILSCDSLKLHQISLAAPWPHSPHGGACPSSNQGLGAIGASLLTCSLHIVVVPLTGIFAGALLSSLGVCTLPVVLTRISPLW